MYASLHHTDAVKSKAEWDSTTDSFSRKLNGLVPCTYSQQFSGQHSYFRTAPFEGGGWGEGAGNESFCVHCIAC